MSISNVLKTKTIKKMYNEKMGIFKKTSKLEFISTGVKTLNILFSGRINGGIPKYKISEIAGISGSGKSLFSLMIAKNALKAGMDVVYIDTEYAMTIDTIDNFGLTDAMKKEKFVLFPESNITEIKQFLSNIYKELTTEEKLNTLIIIDSWGMLKTHKIQSDAEDGKNVQDLQTTREKNSLAVLMGGLNPITFFVSNHTYESLSAFSPVGGTISGGSKLHYVSSAIVQTTSISKQKDDSNTVEGIVISAKTAKGRLCKMDSKLKFKILFNGIVHPTFGLLEKATELGFISVPTTGFYTRTIVKDDKKWRKKELEKNWKEFWSPIFKDEKFIKAINELYMLKDIKFEN